MQSYVVSDNYSNIIRTFAHMKIIVAIDSFKGCITSAEANQAVAEGIRKHWPKAEVVQIPVSDGGEGWIVPFIETLKWKEQVVLVHDPLMRTIHAHYAMEGNKAVIEIAQACGLTLLKKEERNPLIATTYGVGEIIIDAMQKGCHEFIIGLGGSATSDVGKGMLEALTPYLNILTQEHYSFTIASDVDNPLCGKNGAAYTFAPQKGATPEMVEQLDQQSQIFAKESATIHGYDCSQLPGAGAAGGLGYAFMQYLHANRCSGATLLMDMIGFDQILTNADLVITGEGHCDRQTLMGKLPFAIMQRAKLHHVPTILLAGIVSDKEALLQAGFQDVRCINPPHLSIEEAMRKENAMENLRRVF